MKQVRLTDGTGGWNPDDLIRVFTITDSAVNSNSVIVTTLDDNTIGGVGICSVGDIVGTSFKVRCTVGPLENSVLNYVVINK